VAEAPRRDRGTGARRLLILLLAWGLVKALLLSGSVHTGSRDLPMRTLPPPPDSTGTFAVDLRWNERSETDPPFLGLKLHADLEYSRLAYMSEHYGVPEEWLETLAWEARLPGPSARFREIAGQAARRGVLAKVDGYTVHVEPDYRWIIDESHGDVEAVARGVRGILTERGHATQRDLHRVAASLVQCIPYAVPELTRTHRSDGVIANLGIATPIEVLHNYWGDCDSKSLLFAALLEDCAEDQKVIFLRGVDHLFVGVRSVPRRGDHFVTVQGTPYVLIEMTFPWPVGHLPADLWTAVQGRQFAVIAP